jgi:hypothetical protein
MTTRKKTGTPPSLSRQADGGKPTPRTITEERHHLADETYRPIAGFASVVDTRERTPTGGTTKTLTTQLRNLDVFDEASAWRNLLGLSWGDTIEDALKMWCAFMRNHPYWGKQIELIEDMKQRYQQDREDVHGRK